MLILNQSKKKKFSFWKQKYIHSEHISTSADCSTDATSLSLFAYFFLKDFSDYLPEISTDNNQLLKNIRGKFIKDSNKEEICSISGIIFDENQKEERGLSYILYSEFLSLDTNADIFYQTSVKSSIQELENATSLELTTLAPLQINNFSFNLEILKKTRLTKALNLSPAVSSSISLIANCNSLKLEISSDHEQDIKMTQYLDCIISAADKSSFARLLN